MEQDKYEQHLDKVVKEVNAVSPSFCVAKWKQVTMHLHNGHTHSCHHPNTHLVPIEEIKVNPSALHNTKFKKELRKQMLEGIRPTECDYCWKAEDAGSEKSDRIYKSADPSWAYPHIQEIANKPWDDDVDPSYVEVSFSSVCNFKCSYCSPNISSKWMEEIERFGPYPTSTKFNDLSWIKLKQQMPIPNNQENPYMEAFWKWWPKMYTELKQFRITGGEPLLSKDTFKVLDYIIENPNTNLVFSVNTNLNPPKELFDKFIEKLKIIQENKSIHRLHIFTSAEAYGKQAEYIRNGMNYAEWLGNIERLINEVPNVSISVTCTYNILSVLSFKQLLEDVLAIRLKYRDIALLNHRTPLAIDIPYLRWPAHQPAYLIPPKFVSYIEDQIKFMEANIETGHINFDNAFKGFHDHEIYKLKRILNVVHAEFEKNDPNLSVNRKDFVEFVDEHDLRRGTNFLETFAGFTEMYTDWKKL
ncbi:MAG: twitch domain-containing radical SAM protein [Candidatus Nanopelagicus sp.]